MAPPRKATEKAGTKVARAWQPPPPPPKTPLPPVFPHRWACAYGEDEFGLWQAFEVKGVRQLLRWIPPGNFLMGSPEGEAERIANGNFAETLHRVAVQGFWLADTVCTQELWKSVMGDNPSEFRGDLAYPVVRVSWIDVKEEFLPALSRLVPGLEAKLPSEAQWEYACRAGTQTPFWFGEQITRKQVNYNGEYPYVGGKTGDYRAMMVAVKSLPVGGWGLYEMHGNVREWCEDVPGEYPSEGLVDPSVPRDGHGLCRVQRGGCWYDGGRECRSAKRSGDEPAGRYLNVGFRLARGAD